MQFKVEKKELVKLLESIIETQNAEDMYGDCIVVDRANSMLTLASAADKEIFINEEEALFLKEFC